MKKYLFFKMERGISPWLPRTEDGPAVVGTLNMLWCGSALCSVKNYQFDSHLASIFYTETKPRYSVGRIQKVINSFCKFFF